MRTLSTQGSGSFGGSRAFSQGHMRHISASTRIEGLAASYSDWKGMGVLEKVCEMCKSSGCKVYVPKNAQTEETKTICCTDSFMHCASVQGAVQCHVWEVQIRLAKWLCIFCSL